MEPTDGDGLNLFSILKAFLFVCRCKYLVLKNLRNPLYNKDSPNCTPKGCSGSLSPLFLSCVCKTTIKHLHYSRWHNPTQKKLRMIYTTQGVGVTPGETMPSPDIARMLDNSKELDRLRRVQEEVLLEINNMHDRIRSCESLPYHRFKFQPSSDYANVTPWSMVLLKPCRIGIRIVQVFILLLDTFACVPGTWNAYRNFISIVFFRYIPITQLVSNGGRMFCVV